MSFIVKKKKYKFAVRLTLEGLSSVPYINGLLYAKVRLVDGGHFVATSSREEVNDHMVRWDSKFDMECKMSANASNGVLNSCLLRISVRKVSGRCCLCRGPGTWSQSHSEEERERERESLRWRERHSCCCCEGAIMACFCVWL